MSTSFISSILRGSFWVTLSKWCIASLGIISTLVLARLLTPQDFGIVATATLVTAFFDLFSRIGTEQYLIHKTDLTTEDINTAWTLQFLIKIAIAILIFSSAFIVPLLWDNNNIANVLMVLSVTPLLMAGKNIGLVLLKKQMQFKKIMLLETYAKVIAFIVTIAIAFWLKNYWAFIYGTLTNFLVIVIGSYLISDYRPQFCISKTAEQWTFSQWTLLKGIVNYINGKIDQILITKYLSVADLGAFTLSHKIKSVPVDICIAPATDVLFPALAQYRHKPEAFSEKIQKTLFLIIFITAPLACAMMLFSTLLVQLFLGDIEKWSTVVLLLPLVSPLIITGTLVGNLFGIITLQGKTKWLFNFELISAVLTTLICLFALEYYGLVGIVFAKLIISLLSCLFILCAVKYQVGLSLKRLLISSIPIALTNVIVYIMIEYIMKTTLNFELAIVNLTLYGSLFLGFYAVLTLAYIVFLRSINEDFVFLYQSFNTIKRKIL